MICHLVSQYGYASILSPRLFSGIIARLQDISGIVSYDSVPPTNPIGAYLGNPTHSSGPTPIISAPLAENVTLLRYRTPHVLLL
jgi:hypothetical protein